MKLNDLLHELEKAQCYMAIAEELIDHLRKVEAGEVDIPVDLGDGTVPHAYVAEVIEKLEMARDRYTEVLEDAEDLEVNGGTEVDSFGLV